MAFILVTTDDVYTEDLANQVVEALSGVADKGQPIAMTTLDDATNYALTVRNLDTTNGRALRVLDSAGNELLHVDDDGTNFTGDVELYAGSVSNTAIADGAVSSAKLATDSVITTRIKDANVTGSKIHSGAISSAHLANNSVVEAKILTGAVSSAKIATDAVTIDKVGRLVPALLGRQGSDASAWDAPGSTTYTPSAVRIQVGSRSTGSIPATGSCTSKTVTFPTAFSDEPVVLLSCVSSSGAADARYGALAAIVEPTYFTFIVHNFQGTSGTVNVHWLAIGPE